MSIVIVVVAVVALVVVAAVFLLLPLMSVLLLSSSLPWLLFKLNDVYRRRGDVHVRHRRLSYSLDFLKQYR